MCVEKDYSYFTTRLWLRYSCTCMHACIIISDNTSCRFIGLFIDLLLCLNSVIQRNILSFGTCQGFLCLMLQYIAWGILSFCESLVFKLFSLIKVWLSNLSICQAIECNFKWTLTKKYFYSLQTNERKICLQSYNALHHVRYSQ